MADPRFAQPEVGVKTLLFARELDPRANREDRGTQQLRAPVEAGEGSELVLRTEATAGGPIRRGVLLDQCPHARRLTWGVEAAGMVAAETGATDTIGPYTPLSTQD